MVLRVCSVLGTTPGCLPELTLSLFTEGKTSDWRSPLSSEELGGVDDKGTLVRWVANRRTNLRTDSRVDPSGCKGSK